MVPVYAVESVREPLACMLAFSPVYLEVIFKVCHKHIETLAVIIIII